MTGLHTRIAAAIEECPMPVDGQEWSELLAEAVIRELRWRNYVRACAYCDWVGTPEELTTQHLNGCP